MYYYGVQTIYLPMIVYRLDRLPLPAGFKPERKSISKIILYSPSNAQDQMSQRIERRPKLSLKDIELTPKVSSTETILNLPFLKASNAFQTPRVSELDLTRKDSRKFTLGHSEISTKLEYTSVEVEQNMTEFGECILDQRSNNPILGAKGNKRGNAIYK